ncbi:FAD-binding oxidoreductase [Dyadobacter chenwenxiniae]|uniref:FAD-binding oxidoreductase n=1 Tax=Dyadobacter chenwenxiniae TaxID=2906456 RepID=A0A9X1PHY5_9BACT|nr:FAD-dependent oxidoreductase [Dyadobacter chenwenxiniae]MCF0061672.1 FAD-binding oxidoreductase [Dyadobacter chenwenxiniae]UON81493.1 FAD-binding oxidoreductase [Dyadobacter chenwenxiniae]
MNVTNKGKATIIGGGIMGLTSAYYLLKSGWQVTLIDKGDLSDNCSQGNAGMIVPSHFIPLAAPGMISKGIKWMFDSRSPFYVKPSLDWGLVSWGLKFMKSATPANVERAAPYLRDYHLLSKQLYEDLAKEEGFDFGLEEKGILMLYKTEKAGEEEIHVAKDGQKLGLDIEMLTKEQVQAIEPNIKLDVIGAVHYHCDAHLYPTALFTQLLKYIKSKGAELVLNAKVKGFDIKNGEIKGVQTENKTIEGDLVIMTGGTWLPELSKLAGLSIPVMPGKGYSFMEPNSEHKIEHPALLIEARVAVTPMNGQVRFGGTMELAAVNDNINMNRVEGIVNSIPQYYPELNVAVPAKERIWYGFRPCSPDGLPYLGYSKKLKNLIVAGGHGMMGISLGPATGKMVAELANKSGLSADIKLYNPERYN